MRAKIIGLAVALMFTSVANAAVESVRAACEALSPDGIAVLVGERSRASDAREAAGWINVERSEVSVEAVLDGGYRQHGVAGTARASCEVTATIIAPRGQADNGAAWCDNVADAIATGAHGRFISEREGGAAVVVGDVNPPPPNANWTVLAPPRWDAVSAYPANAYVRQGLDGGVFYRALGAIAAPQETSEDVTSYDEEATYNVGGSGNTAGAADYFQSAGDVGLFGIGVFCNANAASGAFPVVRAGTFRLRIVGGERDGASVTGTMQNYRNFLGRHAFYIDTPAAMREAFGSEDFASGGGVWHLERVTTETVMVPGANPLPADDADNWRAYPVAAFDGGAAYQQWAVVSEGGATYRANADIAAAGRTTTIPAPSASYSLNLTAVRRAEGDDTDELPRMVQLVFEVMWDARYG